MHVDEGQALGLDVSYELFDFDLMTGGAACLKDVLDEAGYLEEPEVEEAEEAEVVEQFKDFLDSVNPEDFAS